jgi:hypothetical protein
MTRRLTITVTAKQLGLLTLLLGAVLSRAYATSEMSGDMAGMQHGAARQALSSPLIQFAGLGS